MIKIRWSHDYLIFMMRIPTHGKTIFILNQGPALIYLTVSSVARSRFGEGYMVTVPVSGTNKPELPGRVER